MGDASRLQAAAGGMVLAALVAACGLLAWRVADARTRTPALVAAAVAGADPDIKALPPERIRAYLTVEDPTFWTNDGVDLKTPGAGQTTTTQGLGKLIYFHPFRPGPWDKLQLMLMSQFALSQTASKRDVLTAALALAPLGEVEGRKVTGFAEAARTYYGRPLRELTDDQFLALTAMQLGPRDYSPLARPAASAERVARIRRLIAGACRPTGLDDVTLEGCARGT